MTRSGDTASPTLPAIVFFESARSGRCRRVEGFLASVLQRRQNHGTFRLSRVDVEERPDLAERFRVQAVPTLLVVDGSRVCARIDSPRGVDDIVHALAPWLR